MKIFFFQRLDDIDFKKKFMFVNKLKLEKKYTTPSPFTLKFAPAPQFLHLWVLRACFLSRGVTSMRLL